MTNDTLPRARLRIQQRVQLVEQAANFERLWPQLEPLRFDLREVENVVDDPQQ